ALGPRQGHLLHVLLDILLTQNITLLGNDFPTLKIQKEIKRTTFEEQHCASIVLQLQIL
ncbi:hypothetical protein JRQ81_010671, partial [Phrynocephalus forsythii]